MERELFSCIAFDDNCLKKEDRQERFEKVPHLLLELCNDLGIALRRKDPVSEIEEILSYLKPKLRQLVEMDE